MEISELLEQIDIVEYIEQYVDLEQRGEELWGISPFTYPPENTPSFSVRPATGQFYDFSAGVGGNVLTFARKYHKVSTQAAVEMLQKYANIGSDGVGNGAIAPRLQATSVCKRFSAHLHPKKLMSATVLPHDVMDRYENNAEKLSVWRDEGISDTTMEYFGVKYDSLSDRIVYPIHDFDGNIVNIGGRTLDPDFKAKKLRKYTYLHKWGGRLGVIYGLFENKLAIKNAKEVILFEGVKSVMLAREFGYENCGAILTSHLNPEQAKLLMRFCSEFGIRCVFGLDKEVEVRNDVNVNMLSRYVRVEYIYDFRNLLDTKDAPVDRGADVFAELYGERRRL